MTTRTSTKTVTFTKPFTLRGLERTLSAGEYTVEIYEELIEELSFPVYRRTLTQIHLNTVPGHLGWTQILEIDPKDLDDALARDGVQLSVADDQNRGHG